jgi:tyrosyl-tRNA synthetase
VDDKELKSLTRYFSLELERLLKNGRGTCGKPNALKALLAKELTIRIHGEGAFESAKNVSDILFNAKASKEQLLSLSAEELKLIAGEIPSFSIDPKILNGDISLIDLIAEHTSIVASKSEARRAIQSNAIS